MQRKKEDKWDNMVGNRKNKDTWVTIKIVYCDKQRDVVVVCWTRCFHIFKDKDKGI